MSTRIKFSPQRVAYLAALFIAFAFAACDLGDITDPDAGGRESAQESFAFEVQAASHRHFRLKGVNGAIDVVGVAGARTMSISGERLVRARSSSDARSYLREVEVRVSESNNELLVQTIQPENTNGRDVEVNYEVRVPADWIVRLDNANGLVTVDSLSGNVVVEVANGQVQAHTVTGKIEVKLTNGNVLLDGVAGDAYVAVVNGNAEAKLNWTASGVCELSAVNGNLTLTIPKNTSAQFAADVTNGSIAVLDLTLHNATSSANSVRGQLGSGAGKIALGTINGTIRARGI